MSSATKEQSDFIDLLKHEQLEEVLRFKELILSNIKCIVLLLDKNAKIRYVNASACKSFGYTKDELLSMDMSSIDPYWSSDRWLGYWDDLKLIGSLDMELRHMRRNGDIFPVETNISLIKFGDKEYALLLARDITEKRETEKVLNMLSYSLDSSPETVVMVEPSNAKIIYANDTAAKMLGYTREELTGGMDLFDIDPDIWPDECTKMMNATKEKRTLSVKSRHLTKDGLTYPVEITANYFEYDKRGYILAVCKDITEHIKTANTINLLTNAINASSESVFLIDAATHKFSYVNDVAAEKLGYSKKELYKMKAIDIDPTIESAELMDEYTKVLNETGSKTFETRHKTKNGYIYPVEIRSSYIEHENEKYILAIAQDITEKKAAEHKIEFLARHDALTGLPNRALTKDRMEQAIAYAKRNNTKAALLFVDMDDFKAVNESIGHSVGDTMLKLVATRLKENIREVDTLGRQGGDEFLVVLTDVKDTDDVLAACEKLMSAFKQPFCLGSHILSSSVSIGVAVYPIDGEEFETLLQKADTAMYKAKESGRNTCRLFEQDMNNEMLAHLHIHNGLKTAMEDGNFILHYQPQIDATSNAISGIEALVRWNHPQDGLIPPVEFIPISESSGLIVQLGEWIIKEACAQAAKWHKMGINAVMAVNISAIQFKRGNLEQVIKDALSESGLPPHLLELELTESILINDTDKVLDTVRRLKSLGVKLSIDDFGTGYSSLSYLKRFAVDKLKIDRSFVQDIVKDQENAAIVQAIIQMAKSLNLRTIAEGVEDKDTLDALCKHGCNEIQGYYFAKPMPANEFEEFFGSRDGTRG